MSRPSYCIQIRVLVGSSIGYVCVKHYCQQTFCISVVWGLSSTSMLHTLLSQNILKYGDMVPTHIRYLHVYSICDCYRLYRSVELPWLLPGSCPVPCRQPRLSVTTCGTGGREYQRWAHHTCHCATTKPTILCVVTLARQTIFCWYAMTNNKIYSWCQKGCTPVSRKLTWKYLHYHNRGYIVKIVCNMHNVPMYSQVQHALFYRCILLNRRSDKFFKLFFDLLLNFFSHYWFTLMYISVLFK